MNETPHTHHNTHHNHRHPWSFLRDLEKLGDEYLVEKAPLQIPHKWKLVIAKLLPILVLIAAIVSIPGIIGGALFALGFAGHSMLGRGMYTGGLAAAYPIILIQVVITVIVTVLYFKSFNPLKQRKYIGRAYIFYAGLLGLVANLIDGGIVGALVAFLISMYLLFQAKELYK